MKNLPTTLIFSNFYICMPEASIILLILLGLCRDKRVFSISHFTEQLTHVLVSRLSVPKLDKPEAATTNQIEVSGHIKCSRDTWTFNYIVPSTYVPHILL